MSTFNAYGQKAYSFGGNTPIWLGTVTRVPVGGVLAEGFVKPGILIPAGTPVNLAGGILTPLAAYKVVASSADSMTVAPLGFDLAPVVGDNIMAVGANFSATGTAAGITGVTKGEGGYVLATTLNAGVGKIVVFAAAAGSGKSMKAQPNGYLYHDIYIDAEQGGVTVTNAATGAVVVSHPEGILIERNEIANAVASQMAVAVPGVIQIKG